MTRQSLSISGGLILAGCLLFMPGYAIAGKEHSYPNPEERADDRREMVETLQKYGIGNMAATDQRVIRAMLKVPRHHFVPWSKKWAAYADTPLAIGYGQTISQPYIVALMTQLADIKPGMSVLEVGTGSGYQAALLFELTDHIYTIEIVAPLADRTQELFASLDLKGINAREGDGYFGWPEPLMFDRILVTAAAAHIPPSLLAQLKPGGIMVIPVGPRWGNQVLMMVTKDGSGQSRTRSLLPVRFVPLTGGKGE